MKNTKKFIPRICIVLFLTGIILTACTPEKKENIIHLNEVVHSIFYAPQYVALEKGFFEAEGLEIILDVGQGADKSMTALIAEEADIALLGTEAGIYVYGAGKEDHAIGFAQLTKKAGNFLVARTPMDNFSWDQLAGKEIIGGRIGGMPQMILESILTDQGLDIERDLTIINNLDFTTTAGAFAAGIGDFTVEFEPSALALEESGHGYVVASLGEASGEVPYTIYMAQKSYIEENPETIQAFTNAIAKGLLWVSEHESAEIAAVIHPYFSENTLEELTQMIDRYKSISAWNDKVIIDEDGFGRLQEIMIKGNELEEKIPFKALLTNRFAEKALLTTD